MRFMLLIHQGEALDAWGSMSDEEQKELAAAWGAISETPGVTPGEWLAQPTQAKTVRVRKGQPLITDGPYAETKDSIGGYLLYDADSIDDAVALAQRIPSTSYGGAVEVRPIQQG